ncbi:MAG: TolC family protein [bacterium]
MKIRYVYFILIALMCGKFSHSQTMDDFLEMIEKNNTNLKAARQLEESERLMAQTGIYPSPLSVEYGYFPDNHTVEDMKQTSSVSQAFQLPGVYKAQNKLADSKIELANNRYREQRNDILLRAQKSVIHLIFLKKKEERLQKRLNNAEEQYKGLKEKFESGDADVMEVNKSRVHLLTVKKDVRQNMAKIRETKEELQLLNGGEELDFVLDAYPVFPQLAMDSVVSEKKEYLPLLKSAEKEKNISERQVQLAKKQNYPEFKVGYGSETVGNASFKGVVMGVSIPLWTNKNKLKAARAEKNYQDIKLQQLSMEISTETKKEYEEYLSLKESLEEYKKTLDELQSFELLRKSFEKGQLSLIDYIRELQFYFDVYDDYLELEKEYYLTMAELYKYRL